MLELEGCSEDDLDSLNRLFHWQMEDYELFLSCNMLGVEGMDGEEKDVFPLEFGEYKEGEAQVNESLGHNFDVENPIRYEELSVRVTNLWDEENLRNIRVGDDWDSVLKPTTFKIFIEYKDVNLD